MRVIKIVLNKVSAICLMTIVLTSCMQPESGNFNQQVKNMHDSLVADAETQERVAKQSKNLSLPSSVTSKMLPSATVLPGEKQSVSAAKFDVSVNNIDAKEFFSGLATGSNSSIVVSPGVSGNVSLNLKQVTLSQVLDAVTNLYGYRYEKTSYGYNIYPKELETRVFIINKLALERTLQTNTQLNNSGGDLTTTTNSSGTNTSATAPSTVTLQASQKEAFWTNIQTTIAALIGVKKEGKDGPIVQITEETGMVVVRAYPKDMQLVEDYLDQAQKILGRQVIIEAEILDVELTNEYAAGIDWNILTTGGSTLGVTPENLIGNSNNSTVSLIGNVYSLSLSGDNNNFQYAINLLSTQGKISVLSKPRVSAVNNQSAIIKVGTDNYYVTNVQSQVTTGGTSDTSTSTINLQAFFSGISLYITPQITEEGEVNLHIHPAVSRVTENDLQVQISGQNTTLPVAESVLRETDTVVRAKNGQVLILGGLIQENSEEVASGLPLDSKYNDKLGALTTSHKNGASKTELVILLRPLIVEDQSMRKDLKLTAQKLFTEKSTQEFFDNAYRN